MNDGDDLDDWSGSHLVDDADPKPYVWVVSPWYARPAQGRSAGVRLVCPSRHPLGVVQRGWDTGTGYLCATLSLTNLSIFNLDQEARELRWRCAGCRDPRPVAAALSRIERRLNRLARDDAFADFELRR